VPIKAKVLLNPLKLYALFGKVPIALVLHMLVVLVDGWFLVYGFNDTKNFMPPSKMFLYTKFLDKDIDRNNVAMST
jgi:hypothetical protein